ncbi:HEPN domain-containing protein [Persephonella hydrogeniphila]|uniref:HEPN domain-containing protein n=1 Tax=Persephonella hydrogeniphila TaxID=198703 RepID=A0A285NNV0_9AQUI|nr:HEPN domain-containing protein [Persephonella hydrogeniphila]SNZ11182.1 HEPN domain-containing protein [Persephonella hydrogeniphila]
MSELLDKAREELEQVEELLEVDFCDDGLVFYHLQNAVTLMLKAIASEYKLNTEGIESIADLIDLIKEKTTIKFPEWISRILEIEEISISDGCGASICYDIDMYGDILDAVYQLKDFVETQVSE